MRRLLISQRMGDRTTLDRLKLVTYSHDVQAHGVISERFPEVASIVAVAADEMLNAAIDADIIFMARAYKREMVLCARSLKWLHLAGAGVDRLRPFDDLPPEITITHTPSLNAHMMADYVMCVISMLTWKFPRILRNQQQQCWQRWSIEKLEGKTLVLVGMGNVGTAIASRARAAQMSLVGVRRRPQSQDGFARVVAPHRLMDVLPQADYLVICAPLTAETESLIGSHEMQVMKPSAYLVNVGRGAIIDEEALGVALEKGQIAGAALDVFVEEPLPTESKLWQLPNVITTPHISAYSPDYDARALALFCSNLERFLAGKTLRHVVDRSREY